MNAYRLGSKCFNSALDDKTDAFLKGKVYTKDANGVRYLTNAEPGATKKNSEYIRKFNDLYSKFGVLICTEYSFIRILKLCQHNSWTGAVGNLYNIVTAQKGTRQYIYLIKEALKKYKVNTTSIIAMLDEKYSVTLDRLNRNKEFLNEFANEAGLGQVIKNIESKYSTNLFEYLDGLFTDYTENYDTSDTLAERDVKFTEYAADKLMSEARDAGIDIIGCVTLASEMAKGESERKARESREALSKAREDKYREEFKQRVSTEVASMMNSYRKGSPTGGMTWDSLYKLINLFRELNGKPVYYVMCAKRVSPIYWNSDKGTVGAFSSASLFNTYEEAEAQANVILEEGIAKFTDVVELKDPLYGISKSYNEDWSDNK